MITTYWRIPNIFTISQEHKGKTTGNGANFPTLHSNKPKQRSEKRNAETQCGHCLDPQKKKTHNNKNTLTKPHGSTTRLSLYLRRVGGFTAAPSSKILLWAPCPALAASLCRPLRGLVASRIWAGSEEGTWCGDRGDVVWVPSPTHGAEAPGSSRPLWSSTEPQLQAAAFGEPPTSHFFPRGRTSP